MARLNGGKIFIRISKDISDITSDDFDKSLFREIVINKIKKPLRLETLSGIYDFPVVELENGDLIIKYTISFNIEVDEDYTFSSLKRITIAYNSQTDDLVFEYYLLS